MLNSPIPQQNQPPSPAAVYVRVSSVRQATSDLKSLQTQVDECLAYAQRHNLTVSPEFIVEEVFTGTVTEHRPKLEALVNQMVRAGVKHIIMDETKRFTREGQAAAGYLLHYLEEHGLMLHLAMDNLAVNSEVMVLVVMTKAFAAKLDNEERVKKAQRNKREYARSFGRFPIAPNPPYGWRYEPCEVNDHGRPRYIRLVHNPDTYPTLLLMLRLRQTGHSWRGITHTLTKRGIPIDSASRDKADNSARAGTAWSMRVVKRIVENPVNAGRWEAFRHKAIDMPPDEKHPYRWKRTVLTDPSERVVMPADRVVDPPLTWDEHLEILALGERGPSHAPLFAPVEMPKGVSHPSASALFRGGVLTHTDCGRRLRLISVKGRREGSRHAYYQCGGSPHDERTCLTGFCAPTANIDDLVWRAVRRVLLMPGRLEQVAEAQQAADLAARASAEGLGSVASIESHHRRLTRELDNFIAAVGAAKPETRHLYEAKAEETAARLAEVDKQLDEARALAADEERRRLVLSTLRMRLARYATVVGLLHLVPDRVVRIQVQRDVLRALGARVSVTHAPGSHRGMGVQTGKRYEIRVELRLVDALAQPWFGSTQTPEGAPEELWERLAGSFRALREQEGIGASTDLAEGESEQVEEDGRVRFILLKPTF